MDYDYELSDVAYDYNYDDDDYGDYTEPVDYTLTEMYKDCLVPTLSDGFKSCYILLLCSTLLKLLLQLSFLPIHAYHISSSMLGIYCLYSFFRYDIFYIVVFAVIGYVMLYLSNNILRQFQGIICALVCYSFLIVCELYFDDKTLWHRIRGCQMLISMKLISLAFDIEKDSKELPSFLSCLGYLFHPGTVIFGPWISFSTYLGGVINSKFNFLWIFTIVRCLFTSFIFLTISTCWSNWIFFSTGWKWLDAYRDALSFRSSHYFVSYLSEATSVTSGLRVSTVAAAINIEFPRSLVEVVVWWNVPMHSWLKTYVFKTAKPFGDFAAILLTYAASALLHGLNFQLAAVLLSLGFYTYIEHVLRKKLATAFDACILARKCHPECNHLFKGKNPYVIVTNIFFGFLSVFHLAYLGVMFDSNSHLEEEGYNMNHTLLKWSHLDYSSHWVAAVTYGFYYLI